MQGPVFVDRDGEHFRHVLNWLRDGAIPALSDTDHHQLLREAQYYQLLVIQPQKEPLLSCSTTVTLE